MRAFPYFSPFADPVLIYMAVWGLWTALLRPLSGDSGWETIERAGNYGVPLALLVLVGMTFSWKNLFSAAQPVKAPIDIAWVLRISTFMLLLGHGALMASGKPMLLQHGSIVGLAPDAVQLVGWFEVALAVLALVRPTSSLLIFVCLWKLTTEFFFILAGAPAWEFVERAGSYIAPLCLAYILYRAMAPKPLSASTAQA